MTRKDFEIMAPVGSLESLEAAISAGADAVYFGVGDLNMRSHSSVNFTLDHLRRIVERCDEAGVKSYLTVNTIIYDNETARLDEILATASEAGVSAIIAADIAVIMRARAMGLEVHISTQLNVSNIEAVRFWAQWADVMVLARELSMEQVAAISRAISEENIIGPSGRRIRIEMFCHGALCMAVSGKCYLSLHEMNSSANRGACTQICRRGYEVTDLETGDQLKVDNKYIMSPKDLKTIHFLNKMIDAGVTVFKIEGRARGPEYVATTVRAYSEAISAICDGTYSEERIKGWDEELRKVFNRGFWDGYYMGQRLGEWSSKYGSSATRVKRYVARCTRYYPRLGVGEFLLQSGELHPGDEIVITGQRTGAIIMEAGELRLERDPEPVIVKGQLFSLKVPTPVRPGDQMYLWEKKE
ncbi:MAG: U32 family peptidase [Duncaniella sp.]|nr:U32 family peptidase [Duncaniella sp.]